MSVGGEGRRPKETAQTSPFTCQIPNYFSCRLVTGIFKFEWFSGGCLSTAMPSLLYKGGVCELQAKNAFLELENVVLVS